MEILPYATQDSTVWDEFVDKCPMATFLHSRRFLSYHGDRFKDASLFLKDEKRGIVGVLPAAIDPGKDLRVSSHPGITFGGLLHAGDLLGERMIEAFEVLLSHYRARGLASVYYKAIPYIYHRMPSGDDLYALSRLPSRRLRCDLSAAIDLANRRKPGSRRSRGVKRAQKANVRIADGAAFIEPFWQVLEKNLSSKFDLRPVHTISEIRKLLSLFPENIEFVVALVNSEVIAGVVLFNTPAVVHCQYTAASETGQDACALDAVFEHCIEKAKEKGARYFNFGISTENDGQELNSGLYRYKSEFGAGGVVHDFFEIDLHDKLSSI
jgi:hypothetical protein